LKTERSAATRVRCSGDVAAADISVSGSVRRQSGFSGRRRQWKFFGNFTGRSGVHVDAVGLAVADGGRKSVLAVTVLAVAVLALAALAASFGGIHNVLKLNQEISLTMETKTICLMYSYFSKVFMCY